MRGISTEYILKRFAIFLLTVWLGATLIFFIPRLAPGDPITAMIAQMSYQGETIENSAELIEVWRNRFGLDGPLHIQYLKYLKNITTFELGYSLSSFPVSVQTLVSRALPWTLGLLSISIIISFIIGNIIGALMAWKITPYLLKLFLPLTLLLTAIPAFMAAIVFLYIFAFGSKIFPYAGAYGRGLEAGWNLDFITSVIYHGTLPALVIVFTSMGFWALGMRGMIITNEGEDYMILAEAKGLSKYKIFWKYGIRNALLPQVTALGLQLGLIMGGTLLVEYIFAYPGTGYLLYQSILNTDYTLIQGIVYILIVMTAFVTFLLDLTYPFIDPRITFNNKSL